MNIYIINRNNINEIYIYVVLCKDLKVSTNLVPFYVSLLRRYYFYIHRPHCCVPPHCHLAQQHRHCCHYHHCCHPHLMGVSIFVCHRPAAVGSVCAFYARDGSVSDTKLQRKCNGKKINFVKNRKKKPPKCI